MEVRTLSDYQISELRGLFKKGDDHEPLQIKINHIGLIENGQMVVEYFQYGILQSKIIPRYPKSETKLIKF